MFIWNSIAMSNIIDAYCVYCCAQEIKQSTEETKDSTSKKAYNNRKRYYLLQKLQSIFHRGLSINRLIGLSRGFSLFGLGLGHLIFWPIYLA